MLFGGLAAMLLARTIPAMNRYLSRPIRDNGTAATRSDQQVVETPASSGQTLPWVGSRISAHQAGGLVRFRENNPRGTAHATEPPVTFDEQSPHRATLATPPLHPAPPLPPGEMYAEDAGLYSPAALAAAAPMPPAYPISPEPAEPAAALHAPPPPSTAAPALPAPPIIRPRHLGGSSDPRPRTFPDEAIHPLYLPRVPAVMAEVARLPQRRRDDFLPDVHPLIEPLPQAELPPGFTDPITGLPLAEAMRADIEMRASDFRTFTVVVCHPMLAMMTPGGTIDASPNAPVDQGEVRIFAAVLRDALRQRDIVGRYDSRLFLLFLPRCKVEEVDIPMHRIRTKLLAAQPDAQRWVDIAFGAAAGQVDESLDAPLRRAYADLLRRNVEPAWFLLS